MGMRLVDLCWILLCSLYFPPKENITPSSPNQHERARITQLHRSARDEALEPAQPCCLTAFLVSQAFLWLSLVES